MTTCQVSPSLLLQIKDFFYEVTNVMMTNVNVEYDESKVSELSAVEFPYISKGREMIVSGKLSEFSTDIDPRSAAMDPKYNIKGKVAFLWFLFKICTSWGSLNIKTRLVLCF